MKKTNIIFTMIVSFSLIFTSLINVSAIDYYEKVTNKQAVAISEVMSEALMGTALQPEADDKIFNSANYICKRLNSQNSKNKIIAQADIGKYTVKGIARLPEAEGQLNGFFKDMSKIIAASSDSQAVKLGILGEFGVQAITLNPECHERIIPAIYSISVEKGHSDDEYILNSKLAGMKLMYDCDDYDELRSVYAYAKEAIDSFVFNKTENKASRIKVANAVADSVINRGIMDYVYDADYVVKYYNSILQLFDSPENKDPEFFANVVSSMFNPVKTSRSIEPKDSCLNEKNVDVLKKSLASINNVNTGKKKTFEYIISNIMDFKQYFSNISDTDIANIVQITNNSSDKYQAAIESFVKLGSYNEKWPIDGKVMVSADAPNSGNVEMLLEDYLLREINKVPQSNRNILKSLAVDCVRAMSMQPAAFDKINDGFQLSKLAASIFNESNLKGTEVANGHLLLQIARQPEASYRIRLMYGDLDSYEDNLYESLSNQDIINSALHLKDYSNDESLAYGIILKTVYEAVSIQPEACGQISSTFESSISQIDISKEMNDIIKDANRIIEENNSNHNQISIADAKVDIEDEGSFVYTGNSIKPNFTVKIGDSSLELDEDYIIAAYKNNVKAGKAQMIIVGQGKYKGKIIVEFTIKPNKTSVSKLTSSKKSITIKVKKSQKANATGYQVRYSTNPKMKNPSISNISSKYNRVTKKISGLKSNKKYYVQVRVFKKVNGNKIYSEWSAIKNIKVK